MVQRGDIRQYNATGVDNSASNTGNAISALTDTVMQLSNMAITANQQAEKTKIFNNISQANTELYKINEQLKTEFAGNPASPDLKKKRDEAFNSVFDKYGQGISKLAQREWNNQKTALLAKFELSNAQWLIATQKDNALSNLKIAIQNNAKMADHLGSAGKVDELVGLVETTGQELFTSASTVIGEPKAKELLYNYASDMAKSFLASNIKSNPKQAIELLKDERVKKIVNDDEEIAKLKEAAIAQDIKQIQINQHLKTLEFIKKNGEIAEKAISGELSFAEMQDFFAKHKDLPEWQKKFILKSAGYSLTGESVQFENGVLRKTEDIREEKEAIREARRLALESRRAAAEERRARAEEIKLLKEAAYADLTMEGAEIINGDAFTSTPADYNKKGKAVQNGFARIKKYQEKLNRSFEKGYINQSQWKELSNSYIAPLTEFLSSNLQGLEERDWFNVLGYSEIKKNADLLDPKAKVEKALLYSNYYEELQKAARDNNLQSIYQIETLGGAKQKEIYRTATENAIKRTKTTSTNPHIWFKSDYPAEAAAIEAKLPKIYVPDAMRRVGKQVYNSEKLPDVPKIVGEEIRNQTIKNNQTLNNAAMQAKIKELKKRGLTDEKINILMKLQENL